jgi:hypothetical protein
MRHVWTAIACVLRDEYVFPAFEGAICLLFFYALYKNRQRSGMVKRGGVSRNIFHVTYGLTSVSVLQVVNSAESLIGYKTILSIADITILAYLCYLNGWTRNKIISWVVAWQNRLE